MILGAEPKNQVIWTRGDSAALIFQVPQLEPMTVIQSSLSSAMVCQTNNYFVRENFFNCSGFITAGYLYQLCLLKLSNNLSCVSCHC